MKLEHLRLLLFGSVLVLLRLTAATPGGGLLPGRSAGGGGGGGGGVRVAAAAGGGAGAGAGDAEADGDDGAAADELVVVATVDGTLHGVSRRTGRTLWATRDDWGPLASSTSSSADNTAIGPDGVLVPEPAGAGALFLLTAQGDITRLPWSVKQFVHGKAFVTDGGIAYSTRKVSRLLALDPRSGKIVHALGADDDFSNNNNNNNNNDWRKSVPNPIIISRTEYILMMSDVNTQKLKWNITFGEYESAASPDFLSNWGQAPNSIQNPAIGASSSSSFTTRNNNRHSKLSISANVDGVVILDDLKNENAWELNFNSPALAAFSVNAVDSQGHQVEQIFPSASAPAKTLPGPFQQTDNNVFVGIVDNSYYLLTQQNTKLNGISNGILASKQKKDTIDAPAAIQKKSTPPKAENNRVPDTSSSSSASSATDTTALTIPCTPTNPTYPSCLVGIHTVASPPQQKSPRPNRHNPSTVITSDPIPLPTAPELDDFFHVTSGWRFVEQFLGFTDRTERTFVYLMTFMALILLTSVGYYIGSGSSSSSNIAGGSGKAVTAASTRRENAWFSFVNAAAGATGFGVLKIGGVPVTTQELERRYRGLVKKFSDVEISKPLLPEHVDAASGGGAMVVPLNSVASGLGGGVVGGDEELVGGDGSGKIEDRVEADLPALPVVNPFDIVNQILADAKELPAIPVGEGKKKKRSNGSKGGGSTSGGGGGGGAGSAATVSKVHKSAVSNKKKKATLSQQQQQQQQQSNAAKETSLEILSDSVSNDDDDEELLEDNMDQLMAPSAPIHLGIPDRNESDVTIINGATTVKPMPSSGSLKEGATLRTMTVSDHILGHGSHGTMVFKGTFEGRPVAIKRLLLDFYDVAHHEVKILRDSDQHQNVIRYFYQEATERFMYIALELCPASLADVIENTTNPEMHQLRLSLKPRNVLSQIISGIQYLHSLKLVHRDIKPQNILIGESKGKLNSHPRILITDFGLCKRLADDQSSFHNTMHTSGGTIGWRAPECMINHKPEDMNSSESEHSQWVLLAPSQQMRITKSIDVFSAGCVFYYYLTGGIHPFGDKYTREINILRGNHRLDRLDAVLDGGVEAKDLIKKMIFKDPKKRPDTETILCHPYFWTASQKLTFLQEVSDRLESEERDPPSAILKQLERGAEKAVGKTWASKLDRRILEDLRNFRSYDTKTVQDLLRVIRNKKHHYQELSAELKGVMGALPDGFLQYFVQKYPGLLMHVYYVVEGSKGMKKEPLFLPYFGGKE